MPFENGSVTCRFFSLPRKLPDDVVELFAEKAAPPIDSSAAGILRGWVTGRHLLDRNITEETAYYGNYLRLTLLSAERKIPTSLLRAECKIEELAQSAATGNGSLTRSQRSEIKRSIEERLLPQMPPQLKGIHFVYDEDSLVLFTTAASVKDADLFVSALSQRIGFAPIPILPESLAVLATKTDVRDWKSVSFSPDIEDRDADSQPGREFLTWLWFVSETRGGTVAIQGVGDVSIMIEGPLTFAMEGEGAHETVIRKGEPLLSAEAKTCLLSGKKLQSAKVHFVEDEREWQTTLDADEFVFRSLKLPDTDAVDPVSRFQQRMASLDTLRDMFSKLYGLFIMERKSKEQWPKTQKDIHEWVRSRRTRTGNVAHDDQPGTPVRQEEPVLAG